MPGSAGAPNCRTHSTTGLTGDIYRIAVRFLGADPRIELRESGLDDAAFVRAAQAAGAAWMRTGRGPPPRSDSSPTIQRCGPPISRRRSGAIRGSFKTDVRKLKNLGLTESLLIGYRISPRGQQYLDSLLED